MIKAPVKSRRRRRWLSFSFVVMLTIVLIYGLSSGCFEFGRYAIEHCRSAAPFSYWTDFALILMLDLIVLGLFFASVGEVSQEESDQEEDKLWRWIEAHSKKYNDPLFQEARAPKLAYLLLSLPLLFSLYFTFKIYAPTEMPRIIALWVLTLIALLAVGLLAQWLIESYHIDQEGIRRRTWWRGWQTWRWSEIHTVKMRGDHFENNYALWLFKGKKRWIVSAGSWRKDRQRFEWACHWIIRSVLKEDGTIHIPLDGIDDWFEQEM
ncbi:hypothetical protein ACQZV8_02005 [Magnetococcales bacterium HHB-1]